MKKIRNHAHALMNHVVEKVNVVNVWHTIGVKNRYQGAFFQRKRRPLTTVPTIGSSWIINNA